MMLDVFPTHIWSRVSSDPLNGRGHEMIEVLMELPTL